MEKRTIAPWEWGEQTNSAQAVDVKTILEHYICSGQVALMLTVCQAIPICATN